MTSNSQPPRKNRRQRPKDLYDGPRPQPTESYLNSIDSPPAALTDGTTQPRKLLVLSTNGTILFRARTLIRLRPYMGSLREYLMHPDTQSWLDVMVWSSAMSPNVDLMVEAAFPNEDSRLLAVWARDKMDLSLKEYYRDPPTYKDLAKLWADGELPSNYMHSAHTTILMDEDPQKASKQPYNVLPVMEYTDEKRKQDRELAIKSPSGQTLPSGEIIDEMLLAMVGILDAVKGEENVAGWIRDEGVWRPAEAKIKISLRLVKEIKNLSDAVERTSDTDSKAEGSQVVTKGWIEQPNTKIDTPDMVLTGEETKLVANAKPTEVNVRSEKDVKEEIMEKEKNQRAQGNREGAAEKEEHPDVTKMSEAQFRVPDKTKPWFENPEILSLWCDIGKAALTRMGIMAKHGVYLAR